MIDGKSISTTMYLAIIFFFSISLVLIDLSISMIVTDMHGLHFLDEQSAYFTKIQNSDNKDLNQTLTLIEASHNGLSIFKAWDIVLLLLGLLLMGIFVWMYNSSKQQIRENKYALNLNIIGIDPLPILLVLFFSIGIAFYFVGSTAETNYQQTSTIILSNVSKGNYQDQITLLDDYLMNNLGDYHNNILQSMYFLVLFVYVISGLFLRRINPFFSRSIIVCSFIGTVVWFTIFAVIPIGL